MAMRHGVTNGESHPMLEHARRRRSIAKDPQEGRQDVLDWSAAIASDRRGSPRPSQKNGTQYCLQALISFSVGTRRRSLWSTCHVAGTRWPASRIKPSRRVPPLLQTFCSAKRYQTVGRKPGAGRRIAGVVKIEREVAMRKRPRSLMIAGGLRAIDDRLGGPQTAFGRRGCVRSAATASAERGPDQIVARKFTPPDVGHLSATADRVRQAVIPFTVGHSNQELLTRYMSNCSRRQTTQSGVWRQSARFIWSAWKMAGRRIWMRISAPKSSLNPPTRSKS